MHDPIAYTFEADTHCPACTIARFGTAPGRPWPPEDATDSEGNPIGAVAPWDEWCELSEPGVQRLSCGTCGGTIEEHDHGPECSRCGFALQWSGHPIGALCGPCGRESYRLAVR
jgi:hypothetical protein